MARYDRAITVFSPDGHLFQVEYALVAVRKGNAAVGVRGTDTIVLAVEKNPLLSFRISDPSGTFSAWKANATGRNSNSIREFLEKNYKETSGQETIKLAIRALLEVVESGGKNIEVVVMTKDHGLRQLEEVDIDAIVAERLRKLLLRMPRRLLQPEKLHEYSNTFMWSF
ncbi:Proteasome subunit alpha type-7-B [Striga hermonthica]|uniref:Proteasome subunit alpha type n=1 Tax=Striga hermonthica TaxID=68872 RepID=A0A9N7NWF7_STRHE|nr:Proteasome subunit alpha type-7-B [Striga hermonthica]